MKNVMNCGNCNKEIEDDSKFCLYCGHKIENIENKKKDTENLKKSILKEVIYRIFAVVIAYLGFVTVKIWLVTKGISFGEITLLSIFIFLAIYKIIVGYSLNIKSSKSNGLLFTTISIILVFISVRFEDEVNATDFSVKKELNYLKKQTPKKLDENITLLTLDINEMNVSFEYYINNVSVDNMTDEPQRFFAHTVKKELCKTPIFIKVIEENYNINIKYLDKNYYIIGEMELSKNECK